MKTRKPCWKEFYQSNLHQWVKHKIFHPDDITPLFTRRDLTEADIRSCPTCQCFFVWRDGLVFGSWDPIQAQRQCGECQAESKQ